jgi:hypothetical protein
LAGICRSKNPGYFIPDFLWYNQPEDILLNMETMGGEKMEKRWIAMVLVVVALTFISSPARSEDLKEQGNVALQVLDAAVVRPISAGLSFLSTLVYIGTFPLTFAAGQSDRAEEILVEAPSRFAHARAYGKINRYNDEVPEIGPPGLSKPSTY